jgi:hypothetical protein
MLGLTVALLSPEAGLVALLAAAALAATYAVEVRSRRLCRMLGLRPARLSAAALPAVAIALAGGLLGLAAAQPVVSEQRPLEGRTDAEVLVVLDITRSMLARPSPGRPARFERARAAAKELRGALPGVPVGLVSLSDRVLPHLFPTPSENAFAATLDRAMGVERPPPDRLGRGRITALGALATLATHNFFGAGSRKRVAVVVTDGESVPVDAGTLRARFFRTRITPVFLHVWALEERVFAAGGRIERGYRPDPASRELLASLAATLDGGAFAEAELGAAVAATRAAVGDGPRGEHGRELQAVELAPVAALAAVAPLLLLLWRRNLS